MTFTGFLSHFFRKTLMPFVGVMLFVVLVIVGGGWLYFTLTSATHWFFYFHVVDENHDMAFFATGILQVVLIVLGLFIKHGYDRYKEDMKWETDFSYNKELEEHAINHQHSRMSYLAGVHQGSKKKGVPQYDEQGDEYYLEDGEFDSYTVDEKSKHKPAPEPYERENIYE